MSRIDKVVAEARAGFVRVTPEDAAQLQARGALLVDIRPHAFRAAEGEIPDAVIIERNVLEWRLDPESPWRIPDVTEDSVVVVVCNEGAASSLAARDLQAVGLPHATDLIGGYRAWREAGLPTRQGGTPAIP
jgi:rhodanese-related sulfurtransferase